MASLYLAAFGILAVLSVGFVGVSIIGYSVRDLPEPPGQPRQVQLVLFVDGLFPNGRPCGPCIDAVLGAVQNSPGVLAASFTFQGHVIVTYDSAITDTKRLLELPVFEAFPAHVVEESPVK